MTDTGFQTVWREVGGLPVFAQVSTDAPEGAPDVVLVHGLGLSGTYLMPTARELAGDFRVWVPDLPGFGRSGKPREVWDVARLADALADWMRAAGISKAALVGNSFGCQIIVECAARYPQQVTRIVLQGPTTPPEERSWFWQFVRWRQNPNPGMAPIAHEDYRAAGLYRVLKTFHYSIKHRPEECLSRIRSPVLVVRGEDDPICRQGWAREVAYRSRGRLVVVPGVHHTMVFQNARELARVCRPFLAGREAAIDTVHTRTQSKPPKAPVAGFDSASAMVLAISAFLRGAGFPAVGLFPRWTLPVMRLAGAVLNRLPIYLKKRVYIWAGWSEAVPGRQLGDLHSGELARWVVGHYPKRTYPAAMIGASNGALVHLSAALGIPWLPQTLLVPVRRRVHDANDPQQDLDWSRGPAARLLGANPDLTLYHMHDPNQDQLMIRRMAYFRVKWRRLNHHYRRFLVEHLPRGATLFVVDCRLRWPSVTVGERHHFQRGALGGLTPAQYLEPDPEVAAFLERLGAKRRSWEGPPPDANTPEAEWGFDPALNEDLEAFTREHGFRLRRITFEQPEAPSPLVADLYRDWYRRRGVPANRLLVSNFILMDPYWTLRTGSVPFWTVFNTRGSADGLERYLEAAEAFDEIAMMLFSNGLEAIGNAPIDHWRRLLDRARERGRFIGVDERAYPRDFAVFVRYHAALRRHLRARYPLPPPLTLAELDAFLERTAGRYGVEWSKTW